MQVPGELQESQELQQPPPVVPTSAEGGAGVSCCHVMRYGSLFDHFRRVTGNRFFQELRMRLL